MSALEVQDGIEERYWGIELPEELYQEARDLIELTAALEQEGVNDWNKQAFQLLSKLVFTSVHSYYTTPVNAELPPLAPDVAADDVVETIGLGLTFVLARYLQGRSLQELKDLAAYLDGLLIRDGSTQAVRLAFPLSDTDEHQVRDLVSRVRLRPEIEEYRAEIRELVLKVVYGSVERFFKPKASGGTQDPHLQRAIQYGLEDISQNLEAFLNQLLPSVPVAHLAHFAAYVESKIFSPSAA